MLSVGALVAVFSSSADPGRCGPAVIRHRRAALRAAAAPQTLCFVHALVRTRLDRTMTVYYVKM